jgi:hypothetical protein
MGSLPRASSSASVKPPSGPTKTAAGAPGGGACSASAIGPPPPLSSQRIRRRSAGQEVKSRSRPAGCRISGTESRSLCSAAAIAIEPLGLGAVGTYRQQRRGAELSRLLNQPVEAGALDRREQQPRAGFRFRRPDLPSRVQRGPPADRFGKLAQPFTGGLVKPRDHRPLPQPQYMPEPVCLRGGELDGHAGRERPGYVQACGGNFRQISLRLSDTGRRPKIIA